MIDRMLGRYRIIEKLGTGGMGDVFVAEDQELRRQVALKTLPPDMAEDPQRLARFRKEAYALASLNHPGIVIIHSVEDDDGLHFITMELVEGRNLSMILASVALSAEAFFEIAVPLSDAIAAAHVQGVAHRDLKPANIMITSDKNVKVLDFGLACTLVTSERSQNSSSETEQLLTGDQILGTPDYMSPEQIRGNQPGLASDVYSLGVVFYEMITGRRPFKADTVPDLFAAVLRDRPRPPTALAQDCPARLSRAIERCLAKNPDDRFHSARALHEELAEIAGRFTTGACDPVHSIAVLPFADMSADGDQRHICDGIAEEVISALTRIENMAVASRMSAFQYRDDGGDSRAIGRELGVRYLLEGSVRRVGDRLRVMSQLIDVDDGYHVWSERYDRELRDLFAVQDEIALSIVRSFKLTLGLKGDGGLVSRRTSDAMAYEDYLKGRYFFRRWGKRNVDIALRMFSQAIKRDPDFASAYAGLADSYCYMYMYINSDAEHLEAAEKDSRRALDLDPGLAEAHASRGLTLSLQGRHEEAAKEFEAAIELDPHLFEPYYFYARDCVVQGKYEQAVECYRQASQASPDDYQVPILMAQVHHSLGLKEEAREANRHGLALAEKAILLNPEDARACYMGASAMIRLGQRERGLKWADRALAIDPDDPGILYNVACSYSLQGSIDRAVDCLERTVKVGASYKDWMENDSDLDPLRGYDRFETLLASLS